MIGKYYRCLNSLSKELKDNKIYNALIGYKYGVDVVKMIKIHGILFAVTSNGHYSGIECVDELIHPIKLNKEEKNVLNGLVDKYGGYNIIQKESDFQNLKMRYVILFDLDITTKINDVMQANKKQFKQIEKYNIRKESNPLLTFSYLITNGNASYMTWILKNIVVGMCEARLFIRIMNFVERYPQLISKLSKKNVLAYNGIRGIKELLGEIHQLTCQKRTLKVINQFNTKQKRLLKELPLNKETISMFSKFDHLSLQKQRNFIRKVSTIENVNEIVKQLLFTISHHFAWDKNSVLEYINNVDGINCDKVWDENNVIVFRVHDFDTIKRLGKTTNWCISKNKSYWDNYMYNNEISQYILMDFNLPEDDEHSIIGFTYTINEGITAAHSFTNINLMKEFGDAYNNYGNSVFAAYTPDDINTLLKKHNIPISLFDPTQINLQWEAKHILKKLNRVMGDDYDIIANPVDGVYVIRTYNNKWESVLQVCGDRYHTLNESPISILFLNFNLDKDDTKRVLRSNITISSDEQEEGVCNQWVKDINGRTIPVSFESLIIQYGLDFDIIARVDCFYNRVVALLKSREMNALNAYVDDNIHKVKELTPSQRTEIGCWLNDALNNSIEYFSPSMIEFMLKYRSMVDIMKDYSKEICTPSRQTFGFLLNKILHNSDGHKIIGYDTEKIEQLKINPIKINVDSIRYGRRNENFCKFYLWSLEQMISMLDENETIDILGYLLTSKGFNHVIWTIIIPMFLNNIKEKEINSDILYDIFRIISLFSADSMEIIELLLEKQLNIDDGKVGNILNHIPLKTPSIDKLKEKIQLSYKLC